MKYRICKDENGYYVEQRSWYSSWYPRCQTKWSTHSEDPVYSIIYYDNVQRAEALVGILQRQEKGYKSKVEIIKTFD